MSNESLALATCLKNLNGKIPREEIAKVLDEWAELIAKRVLAGMDEQQCCPHCNRNSHQCECRKVEVKPKPICCNGSLGWYDNGQWVSCVMCPEGKAENERIRVAQGRV